MALRKQTKSPQLNASQHTQTVPPPNSSILKKPWIWLVGSIAALALLLSNINSILSNARTLPKEWRQISDQFFEWFGEHNAWEGHWTNYPEGLVDMAAMDLTSESFRLNVDETKGGLIAGSIETRGICENIPVLEQLLFDGNISSAGNAQIDVFDYVGGYRRGFAKLKLERDGKIMTIGPLDDPSKFFAKETRIALDLDEFSGVDGRDAICGNKKSEIIINTLKILESNRKIPARPQIAKACTFDRDISDLGD